MNQITPKTRSKFALIIFASICSLILTQCALDKDEIQPDYDIEVGQSETHSISGVVVDENGQPITNAAVDVMGSTTETDENGFFLIQADVYAKHAYVKVIKEGYFLGSRSFYPTKGNNMVDITMLKKTIVGSFDADEGGTVKFETVNIDMGAGFVTQNGNTYSGKVNVSAKFIDPTTEESGTTMPGSLRAVSPSGESLLSSFGMMAVELSGTGGSHLQLADGNTAEITSTIPASLGASAPATIPLWYFNEDKGYWVEEGEATKVGNAYVGSVSHFSFWNVDIKIEANVANGTILHENGRPVAGLRMKLKANGARAASGRTNENGQFRGLMPINIDVDVVVEGGPKNAKPYAFTMVVPADGNIPDIVIPDEYFPEPVILSGNIVDCDNNLTDDVRLILNGKYVIPTTNGRFEHELSSGSTYRLEMRHFTEFQKQRLSDLVVKNAPIDLGSIQYCPDNQQGGQLNVKYTSDFESFKVQYSADRTTFYVTKDFKVGENLTEGQVAIMAGDMASSSSGFINIVMTSGFKVDGQPHFYTFKEDTEPEWTIGFLNFDGSTPETLPIIEDIRVDFIKWDLSPGGYSKVIFFGKYKEFNPTTNQYETKTIENGVIEFTMNG